MYKHGTETGSTGPKTNASPTKLFTGMGGRALVFNDYIRCWHGMVCYGYMSSVGRSSVVLKWNGSIYPYHLSKS